jgi:hypothetical protein
MIFTLRFDFLREAVWTRIQLQGRHIGCCWTKRATKRSTKRSTKRTNSLLKQLFYYLQAPRAFVAPPFQAEPRFRFEPALFANAVRLVSVHPEALLRGQRVYPVSQFKWGGAHAALYHIFF